MTANLGDLVSLLERHVQQNDELLRQQNEQIRQHDERINRLRLAEEQNDERIRQLSEELAQELREEAPALHAEVRPVQDDNDRNRIVNLEEVDGEDQSFKKLWIIIGFVFFSMLVAQLFSSYFSDMSLSASSFIVDFKEAISHYSFFQASEDGDSVPDSSLSDSDL